MSKITLIVDDDRTERRLILTQLRGGIDMIFKEAENGQEAIKALAADHEKNISLVILDLDMPVMNGFETLEIIKRDHPGLPVIVLTGAQDTKSVRKAMDSGASDFLNKPVESARLGVSVRNALQMSLMSREIFQLKRRTGDKLLFADLVGCEAGLKPTIQIGRKAAASDLPVLITGETGTGKEMFARAIHCESARMNGNFVAVNCGAIPEKLIESTLFGHEKGAFTGAIAKAPGKFLEASGGTIFLDEVGDLPLEAQVKLLRVLQQKEIEPVGAVKPLRVDVRVISATNRNLNEEMQRGRFREDLFFRLNVLHIDLPPLRERKDDIARLALYFIKKFCALNNAPVKSLSPSAIARLKQHHWPGNVRELENVLNRAMALCDAFEISDSDLSILHGAGGFNKSTAPDGSIAPVRPDGSFKSFSELEQEIVLMALAHHRGNITQTARALGVSKSTVYSKMQQTMHSVRSDQSSVG